MRRRVPSNIGNKMLVTRQLRQVDDITHSTLYTTRIMSCPAHVSFGRDNPARGGPELAAVGCCVRHRAVRARAFLAE